MPYPIKKLGELYDITSSKRVFQSEWKKKGIPFYRAREIVKLVQNGYVDNELYISNNMYDEYSKKYGIPKKGDIMITGVGTIGICYVVKENDKFYFKDGNIIWLKDKLGLANSQFIEYAFKTNFIKKQINNNAGSVVSTYTIINAKNTKIPLPPLPTQKLIVQKLDLSFEKIDKSIELTKKNLQNLEQLNKSILEEFFGKGKYNEFDLLKVADFYNKGILPNNNDLYDYIGLEHIESNTGKLVNYSKTEGKEIKSNKVSFEKGMVLYGKLRPYLNKVLVSEFNGVATTEILPIKCGKNLYNYYLAYYLRTSFFVNLANSNISGARMPRVTTGFLKTIKIPLPPLPKQKEIVKYLDQVFEKNKSLKSEYERKLKDLEEMKQSLLKEAFEGRLVKE